MESSSVNDSPFSAFKSDPKPIHTSGKLDQSDTSFDITQMSYHLSLMEAPKGLFSLIQTAKQNIEKEFDTLYSFDFPNKKLIKNFPNQNIYCDVQPYHQTAVWLFDIWFGNKKEENNYINASRIQSPY